MEEIKKIDAEQSKCKNCGGDLCFSPKEQNLKCERCDSVFEIEHSTDIQKHPLGEKRNEQEYQKFISTNNLFKCPNCGSNVLLNKFEIAKKCPYCETSLVLQDGSDAGLKPDGVIPFGFDEEEASNRFAYQIRKKFFAPSKLKKKIPASDIWGIYIPSFGFNVETINRYNGSLYTTSTSTVNGKTVTTKHDFNVSGTKAKNFGNALVESSSKLTQKELNGILPFNYSKQQTYEDGFIRGYSVEQYDTTVEGCKTTYRSIVDSLIRKEILKGYSYSGVNYLNITTEYNNESYSYFLVPIYKFSYKFKDKQYTTFMNGQTGRVGDDFPKSKLKIALVTILALLVVAIPIIIGIISSLAE